MLGETLKTQQKNGTNPGHGGLGIRITLTKIEGKKGEGISAA